jgi:uncharacterized membrane protein
MQWFYIRDGQRIGPVDESELIRLAREGQLSPDDLVWNPSMGQEWKPASAVPQLFELPADAPSVPAVPGATHNRDLMAKARASLGGQWALAVGATLLYQVVMGGIQMVPYLGVLAVLIIAGPMLLGWNRFFLNLARRKSAEVGQLFDGFKLFGRTFWTYSLVCLFISLWALLLVFPGILAAFTIPMIEKEPAAAMLVVPLLILFGILALIPSIRAALAYSQTFFILSDHPDTRARDAIRQSKQMMNGFKWKLFCLGFRFIGWVLLAILTCGIGILWVYPYMAASNAHFYDDVRTR